MEEETSPGSDSRSFAHRSWVKKFQVACTGLVSGIRGRHQTRGLNSFVVHLPVAFFVVITGAVLRVGWGSMALLLLCIGLVLVAELINSSLELLAQAVTDKPNEQVGAALDISAGAVLMASLTAAVVGAMVLGLQVFELLGW